MTPTPPEETPALTPETAKVADALDAHADELGARGDINSNPEHSGKLYFLADEFRRLAARIRGML